MITSGAVVCSEMQFRSNFANYLKPSSDEIPLLSYQVVLRKMGVHSFARSSELIFGRLK